MAVVSDLLRTGLTVEQQILVNELALAVADAQRASDERAKWRDIKRVQRLSKDKRKEPKENNILYKTPFGEGLETPFVSRQNGTNPRALGANPRSPTPPWAASFDQFWEIYPRRVGKGAAKKAFKNAASRADLLTILDGARRYAKECHSTETQYIKHPTTWLNADCWLDEGAKVVSFIAGGPKRSWAEIKAEKEQAK